MPPTGESVFPGLTVFALGLCLLVAPLTATVLAAAPDHNAGVASGINNAVARAGSLLAVAALPALVGLHGADYDRPATFSAGYRSAMWMCVGLLVVGRSCSPGDSSPTLSAGVSDPERIPSRHAPPHAPSSALSSRGARPGRRVDAGSVGSTEEARARRRSLHRGWSPPRRLAAVVAVRRRCAHSVLDSSLIGICSSESSARSSSGSRPSVVR